MSNQTIKQSRQLKTKIPVLVEKVLKRNEISKYRNVERVKFKPRKIKIKILGVGGGGNSIVSEIAKSIKGLDFLVADTDQRSFQGISSGIKVFEFGQELTKGWGTGMNPEIGEKAALQAKEKIKKVFQNADLTILISCLGGGIGSGALPVFARALDEGKKLTLGIFVLPFNFEGEKKAQIAQDALKNLKENLSGMIVLSNEEILKYSEKKIFLKKSLAMMNRVLIDYLLDLFEIVFQIGIINIDFADVQTILKGRGQKVFFGSAFGHGANRTEDALKELFESHFFNLPSKTADIEGIKGRNVVDAERRSIEERTRQGIVDAEERQRRSIKKILFNIGGGSDLTLKEVEKIGERISELNPSAKIIFGFSRFPKYDKKIKITFLGTSENFSDKEAVRGNGKSASAFANVSTFVPRASIFAKATVDKSAGKSAPAFVKATADKQRNSRVCNIKIKSDDQQVVANGKAKTLKSGRDEWLSAPIEKKKITIRRSALKIKKIKQEEEERAWEKNEKDSDWETPSFLRKKFI
jgi:cell division protein FtsZ